MKIPMICVAMVFACIPTATQPVLKESYYTQSAKLSKEILAKYANATSNAWGEFLSGVIVGFYPTEKKQIALTLDACGGTKGSQIDTRLIEFLQAHKIKATLFVNARWILANKEWFLKLASNPLFEIQNHGFYHRPLSITRREIYHITSTQSPQEVIQEVETNALIIQTLTHKKPRFFRSGTAYYDDVSLQILGDLGYKAMGFSFSADLGATLKAKDVYNNLMRAKSGDIILAHMNKPSSGTAQGIIEALPKLLEQGFEFMLLSEIRDLDFDTIQNPKTTYTKLR